MAQNPAQYWENNFKVWHHEVKNPLLWWYVCSDSMHIFRIFSHFFVFLLHFYSIFPIWFDLFSQIFDFHSHFGIATSSHVCCMLSIASNWPIERVDPEHYNHHPVPAHPRVNYQIWIATFAIGWTFVLTLPFTLFIVFPIEFRLPISYFLCFKFFHLPDLVLKFLYIKHDLSYQ